MLLGGQTTGFYMHEHLPFLPVAPYSTASLAWPHPFPLLRKGVWPRETNSTAWFRLSDRSLISQATPFADHSVGRTVTENFWKTRSFALFAAISYYVATCHHAVCVPWHGRLPSIGLFGDAKQAWVRGKVIRLKPD